MSSTDLTQTFILAEEDSILLTPNEREKFIRETEPRTKDDYVIIQVLGSGSQGAVYKAKRLSDGKVVALKILNVRYGSEKYNQALSEVEMLEKISKPQCNPYLSCYYDHSYDAERNQLLIEMEYIEGKTLGEYAKVYREREQYNTLYKHLLAITKDIVSGLELVHAKNIIHNDIKPENIIIDKNLTPKLVDFGVACKTEKCLIYQGLKVECCQGFSGSPHYVSPEMITKQIRFLASDVWSLGVTLYYTATGTYPFDYSNEKTINSILMTIVSQKPKILNTDNSDLNTIVNGALKQNPFDRIRLREISRILE